MVYLWVWSVISLWCVDECFGDTAAVRHDALPALTPRSFLRALCCVHGSVLQALSQRKLRVRAGGSKSWKTGVRLIRQKEGVLTSYIYVDYCCSVWVRQKSCCTEGHENISEEQAWRAKQDNRVPGVLLVRGGQQAARLRYSSQRSYNNNTGTGHHDPGHNFHSEM